jgi:uncharacterized protein YkwD
MAEKARKLRDVPRSVKYLLQIRLAFSPLFCVVGCSLLLTSEYPALPNGEGVSAGTVLREMNLARQDPALYATYVEALHSRFDGRFIIFPGSAKWRMKEELGAIEEAVRFLRNAHPEQPLTLSPGMCRAAAADHCADQAAGRTGHRGSDRSSPGDRLSRYGVWRAPWGENIAYGKTSAREIILALIIDDGRPARTHRKNIFDPNFNYAGVAYGQHALYGSVCTINFASGYAERPVNALISAEIFSYSCFRSAKWRLVILRPPRHKIPVGG